MNYEYLFDIAFLIFAMILIIQFLMLVVIGLMEKPRNRGSTRFITRTIDKSLDAMEMDKPIRLTSPQRMIATDNFSNLVGSEDTETYIKGFLAMGPL